MPGSWLWQPFSRRVAARRRLVETAERFGLQVQPEARVGELSVGERQRVEILKALLAGGAPGSGRAGTRVLILDEPTAVPTPSEVESLFATLRKLVAAVGAGAWSSDERKLRAAGQGKGPALHA